ncbi:MAG: hypothetical protein EAZ92_14230 [Candidatus Kapaibacterium sp.]|nr:MAG: hypothetical protein EAZ92_14230 [Candidatus Kapabacteria bacterium]
MTDQELKDLVASLALDTQALKAQIAASQAEADRRAAEADRRAAEADKRAAEADRRDAEAKEKEEIRRAEIKAMQKKTDRQLRELGKQIGGIGNKFGKFTEGMSLPSVRKLLFRRFGVEDFMPYRQRRVGAETVELDALGIVNGSRKEAYIVEIKSQLRQDSIEQVLTMLGRFRSIFPEYAHLKLYGIIVAASSNDEALQLAKKQGLYVISFDNNLMTFHDDDGFAPKAY